jgi:hypothetical protein
MPLTLVDILNPGWPVRWKGRTYRIGQIGPGVRAHFDALLRAERLRQADGGDPAVRLAVAAGEADQRSKWGRRFTEQRGGRGLTDAGLVLLAAALLAVRHPEITPDDAAEMLRDPAAGPRLADAIALAVTRPKQAGGSGDGDGDDWHAALVPVAAARPELDPRTLATLSDSQIEFLADAVALAAGVSPVKPREGEWEAEDVLGPDPEPEDAADD